MNWLLLLGVGIGLSIVTGILNGIYRAIARVLEEQTWASWVFGFWLGFLCLITARYFTGF